MTHLIMANKKNSIPGSTTDFLDFFKKELDRLEEEVDRVSKMQEKLASYTKQFDNPGIRGGAHYYIESIKNELQASSQKQSLLRDIAQLRKSVLDYGMRISNPEGDESMAAVQKKLIELVATLRVMDKNNATTAVTEDNLDDEIERRLNEGK